jgi:hypothetical protein
MVLEIAKPQGIAMITRQGRYTVGAAVFAGLLCYWYFWHHQPRCAFVSLLYGDRSVHMRSLHIIGQHLNLVLDDESSMDYLTRNCRSALPGQHPDDLGIFYEASVGLSSTSSVRCGLYIPDQKGSIIICFPLDGMDAMVKYVVILPEATMPKPLAELLARLRSP